MTGAGTFPNFFLIGAPKSGTTSLYEYLCQHPDVFMSPVKEPNFFSWGMGGIPEHLTPRRLVIREPGEYQCLFAGVTDETAIGEASSSYLRVPGTAARIRRHVPDARLVAVLRDPIERAYSSFLMRRRLGTEPLTEFDEAVDGEQGEKSENCHYLGQGRYCQQLLRYLEHFPRRQLQVHLYDDLQADAAALVAEVFRFLGVDDRFRAKTSRRYNRAGTYRSPRVQAFLDELPRPIQSAGAALLSVDARRHLYWRLRAWNTEAASPMPSGTRRRLLPLVRDEILALQELIGRDLSAWLVAEDR